MYNFKALHCYHCSSLILQLPDKEISKLDGLSFECECCGHNNLLSEFKFQKPVESDSFGESYNFEALYNY
ncbi:MAG: hypothetical protein N2484_11355 [Clostridia bacterium]|nr:hypothetical protein [Clostridia bacterium]